jgi:CRISPR-associated endonuclease/helicase Cas3
LEQVTGLNALLIVPQEGEEDDEPMAGIVYLARRGPRLADDQDLASAAARVQLLDEHLMRVGKAAGWLATALNLPQEFVDALEIAGDLHDLGKNRPWWQMALGNTSSEVYAKYPGRHANWKINCGYRHEFGSLLEIQKDQRPSDSPLRDLILHLVAAHHGYARPAFPERAYDLKHSLAENQWAASEVQLRFERLQRTYGWWTLAYLEAVLKAADVMGSREDT